MGGPGCPSEAGAQQSPGGDAHPWGLCLPAPETMCTPWPECPRGRDTRRGSMQHTLCPRVWATTVGTEGCHDSRLRFPSLDSHHLP